MCAESMLRGLQQFRSAHTAARCMYAKLYFCTLGAGCSRLHFDPVHTLYMLGKHSNLAQRDGSADMNECALLKGDKSTVSALPFSRVLSDIHSLAYIQYFIIRMKSNL